LPVCLEGFSCNPVTGECDPKDECAANGEVCMQPLVCVEAVCTDLCDGVTCDPGKICDWETGDCVDE
jgi:hypothetical protein